MVTDQLVIQREVDNKAPHLPFPATFNIPDVSPSCEGVQCACWRVCLPVVAVGALG